MPSLTAALLAGLLSADAQPARVSPDAEERNRPVVYARAGWARLMDDEGSLGTGLTVGAGVRVPLGRRFAVDVAYDQHDHLREFELSTTFEGTEKLFSAKALYFFRPDEALRPYVGAGVGWLDSRRTTTFPNIMPGPTGRPVPAGPPDVFRFHDSGSTFGLSAGFDARVARRVAILVDLTIDVGEEAISSTRLTAGAGWRF
jgi:opacity protein-like surface antigen